MEGDLLELNQTLRIFERDDEEKVVDAGNVQEESVALDADGDDAGTAPLQNGTAPDETFEGVVNMVESNTSLGANATLVRQRTREAVETIHTESELTNNRESVTFMQSTVLPTHEFVNIKTTPYEWKREFPTMFMPVYVHFKGEMRWVILNDITGSHRTRENSVSIHKWYNYIMWRSDGIPSSHPTFSLVLYNHKMRNSLQSQGRLNINTSDIDLTITLDNIRNARGNENYLQIATEDLLKRAHMHASNVPGTMPYWKRTRYEFKAINFFNSYINNRDIYLFHTGSLEEYNEYPLHHLL